MNLTLVVSHDIATFESAGVASYAGVNSNGNT